jgi:regulator of sirC expression with transglutaminase-like and TPR domain
MSRDFLRHFRHELQRPTPQVERLALAIAGMAEPELEIDVYLAELDQLADYVAKTLGDAQPGRVRAARFLHIINHELGFTGNRDDYYDPLNSFLPVVLRQRTGLPIMLSLVCMAIGRRIGLEVEGVGFPGHFMARYRDAAGAWLLDPFNGAVVECSEADRYLSQIFHRPVALPAQMHEAVSAPALAHRILNNLRNVYLSRNDYAHAAQVLDYLLILVPTQAEFWQERGVLHFHDEQWELAARDLKRYFYLQGRLMLALGQDDQTQVQLEAQEEHLLALFHQIEATRRRLN